MHFRNSNVVILTFLLVMPFSWGPGSNFAQAAEVSEPIMEESRPQDFAIFDGVDDVRGQSEKWYKDLLDQSFSHRFRGRVPKQFGCQTTAKTKYGHKLTESESAAERSCLSPDEINSFMQYLGIGYEEWNRKLRSGIDLGESKKVVDHLVSALRRLPPYRGIVFRGSNGASKYFSQYHPGYIFTERAFTSTSLDSAVTEVFEGTTDAVRSIYFTKTCSYVEFLLGTVGLENEILCPPGITFEVVFRLEKEGYLYLVLEEVEPPRSH